MMKRIVRIVTEKSVREKNVARSGNIRELIRYIYIYVCVETYYLTMIGLQELLGDLLRLTVKNL